jgi:hypothetical protein
VNKNDPGVKRHTATLNNYFVVGLDSEFESLVRLEIVGNAKVAHLKSKQRLT